MESTSTDVKNAILVLAQPERAALIARFFKTGPGQYGEGDQFVGLSMPQQHAIVRQYSNLSVREVEKLVSDPVHECRMVGLLIWVNQSAKVRLSSAGYYTGTLSG